MIDRETVFLDKAMESFAGAESELVNGRYNNAANRAYYACFQAAVHALESEGFSPSGPRWSHEAVQATFVLELINRRKVYNPALRETLPRTQILRQSADYGRDVVSEVQAARALRRTREFVEAITRRGGGRT